MGRDYNGVGCGSGIYQIRNLVNNKAYVGSAVHFGERWRLHQVHLRAGTHHSRSLQASWVKHGAEAFVFEVIEVVEKREDLIAREQYHIDTKRTFDNTIGYNMTPTAGSTLGRKASPESLERLSKAKMGFKVSQETKEKISATMKGRKQTPEHIANRAAARKGFRHSEEAKEKIRLAKLGTVPTDEARLNMRLGQLGRKLSPESIAKRQETRFLNKGDRVY